MIAINELAKNGVINLGTRNAWRKNDEELYSKLLEYKIPQTHFQRYIDRCFKEEYFDINVEDQKYKVIFTVDSSD